MPRVINESDWRLFRKLQRVLTEINQLSSGVANETNHQRYLARFRRIERHDRELVDAFNDSRLSTAFQQTRSERCRRMTTQNRSPSLAERKSFGRSWTHRTTRLVSFNLARSSLSDSG